VNIALSQGRKMSKSATILSDDNVSLGLDLADGIDKSIDASKINSLLHPIYEKIPFLQTSFLGTTVGNLILAVIVLLFFFFLRKIFVFTIATFLQSLAKRTKNYYDDRIISALKGPVGLAFVLVGLHIALALVTRDNIIIKNILNTLLIFNIFWAIIALSEALKGVLSSTMSKFNRDLSAEISNFILAIIKVLIGALGLGAMLQVWGVNVTALVASLGLGGLAFALAAKDAASNLFGSFSLLADRSIRIGEWISVNGNEGIVEDIGMRTTKIRAFDKSLIVVPNQLVANSPVYNFSRRGVRRININVGLTYSTTKDQVITIVNEIRTMLETHEDISQDDTLLVNFDSFGESSLNIFIYTYTATANWKRHLEIREDVHIKIMKIVEENGASFAFPSTSLYVEKMPKSEE
jgi:MscS family membrane protein